LSALALPGAGHLYLKHVRRGAALMVLTERVIQMSNGPASTVVTLATLVLAGCWLAGIVDVYRLGKPMGATR
jgi:hypothetical protein